MTNEVIKSKNGITLVTLTITVVILLIVTNIIIYNVQDNLGIEKLRNMQKDIEELTDKISIYYAQYGKIPAKIQYTNLDEIKDSGIISEEIDNGNFYVIDLSAIDNLTLTYGKDYEKLNQDPNQIDTLNDLYIINENSHNIFYVRGIFIKDTKYYTNYTEKDKKSIDLRYVENVKIPEGYKYVQGTKENGIIIKDSKEKKYKWIVENRDITTIPSEISIENPEEFIKSVNLYKGYYKSIEEDDNSVIYLKIQNEWSEKYDIQAQYKDKEGNIATIPQNFKVCKTNGKNLISEGLVIQDEQFNTYVWIPVPKNIYSDENYIINNNGKKVTVDTDYNGIYNILNEYSKKYSKENYLDKWYAQDGDIVVTEDTENLTSYQKSLTNGCGLSFDEYINLRNTMLKSIYNNGGFWISQFEIGTTTHEVSIVNKSVTSQKDMYVYNSLTCAQAQSLVKKIKPEQSNGSLLFGIQWNLVCKFIEENSNKTNSQLNEDSSTFGNYKASSFIVNNAKFSEDNGLNYDNINNSFNKTSNSPILFTTGASDKNCVLNIFDFAGNVEEFTLCQCIDTNSKVCTRGGSYLDFTKAISSYNCVPIDYTLYNVGFRFSIY